MNVRAPAVRIRAAVCTDLPALIALDSVAADDPRRALQIDQWLADGHMHVAELDDTLAGYRVQHRHFFGEAFIEMLMVAAPTARTRRRQRAASACHVVQRRCQAFHLHQPIQRQHAAAAGSRWFPAVRHRARPRRRRSGVDLPLRY